MHGSMAAAWLHLRMHDRVIASVGAWQCGGLCGCMAAWLHLRMLDRVFASVGAWQCGGLRGCMAAWLQHGCFCGCMAVWQPLWMHAVLVELACPLLTAIMCPSKMCADEQEWAHMFG